MKVGPYVAKQSTVGATREQAMEACSGALRPTGSPSEPAPAQVKVEEG